MIRHSFVLLIFVALLLTACGQEMVETTPTPFDADTTAVALLASGPAAPVTIAELLESPELYENQYVAVTGNYAPRPLLVCNDEAYRGPASWTLSEADTISIPVGGYDAQVRSLIAKDTTMTVHGFWRFWEGPVGCGKQAIGRELWYLKVTDLISPEFLALGTIVASGSGDSGMTEPTPGGPPAVPGQPTNAPNATAVTPSGSPITNTVPMTTTQPQPGAPSPGGATVTPTLPGSAGVTTTPTREGDLSTPTSTPTASPTTAVQQTPTANASTTVTPVDPNVTPGATPTRAAVNTPGSSGTYAIVPIEDVIDPDEGMYGLEHLGAWEKQNWTLNLETSDLISITVVGEPNMNLSLVVFDEIDNEIANQNSAGVGQMETINNISVDPDAAYIIQVFETNGIEGDYFMTIVGNETEIILSSRGVLTYGDLRADALPEDHRHFWYFYAEADDVIDITTSADAAMDKFLLITLFDAEGEIVEDEFGEIVEYMEEEVLDLTIQETGLYLIWLEEFAYEPTNYTISIDDH